MEPLPPGEGHSSSCPLGRGRRGSAVTGGCRWGVTLWRRRGEQVLLRLPPLGSSARLSCPRRGGSPTSRLPTARAAGRLSPPFPRRSRLSVFAASIGVGASRSATKSVCSRRRDGSGLRPLREGSVFTGFSGRWSSV